LQENYESITVKEKKILCATIFEEKNNLLLLNKNKIMKKIEKSVEKLVIINKNIDKK
jgi:hypothetical protein